MTTAHRPEVADVNMSGASCARSDIDPELFFPRTEVERLAAVHVCWSCPRTTECEQLRKSYPAESLHGIWHGVLFNFGRAKSRITGKGKMKA